MSDELHIERLGTVDYETAWALQKELVEERTTCPDQADKLLLLEHPPTYTLGRNGDENNLLFDEQARQDKGVSLYRVDRGGDITYHGPGQLVGYPILNLLRNYGPGIGRIRSYVSDLETVLIQTLAAFDIEARLFEGFRGVWVEEAGELNKIAAIGVYVNSKGISSHGFALNIATDLSYLQGIIPCGIEDHGVTSMSVLLERKVTIEEVIPHITETFAKIFGYDIQREGIPHVHH